LRASIVLGNITHKSPEAESLCLSLGIQWPEESTWQAAGETDPEATKQTIREIKAMLTQ